jgi:hypothetical protein
LYGAGLHAIECSLRIKKRRGTKTDWLHVHVLRTLAWFYSSFSVKL